LADRRLSFDVSPTPFQAVQNIISTRGIAVPTLPLAIVVPSDMEGKPLLSGVALARGASFAKPNSSWVLGSGLTASTLTVGSVCAAPRHICIRLSSPR
jgi:hypothetical protein